MPGNIGINVGGAQIVRPSVFTEINTSAMVPTSRGSAEIAGVIGTADGGIPNTVMTFSSFAQAKAVLRGGSILSYLSRIFAPSADLPGASVVKVVRAIAAGTPASQATVNAAGVTFTARDYGLHTNAISVQIAAGTTGWDVTIRKRSEGYARTFSVGAAVQVKSTATTPLVVFDHTNKVVKQMEGGSTVATLPYPSNGVTISNLVAFLNARAGWTAQLAPGCDPSMPIAYMDNPAQGSAPAISSGSFTNLPANQGMLIWAINLLDPVVSASLQSGSTFTVLSTVAETYLASGVGTSMDTLQASDWTTALNTMDTVDVSALFVCSTDSTIQGLAYQNCVSNRTISRKKYRILYTGGGVAQTVAQALAVPGTMPGPVVYCWNGTSGINPVSGLIEQLGGLGTAAQVMGLACGSSASTPITNKGLASYGLEVLNPDDASINSLLVAGVSPVVQDPSTGRTYLVQAITTWQGGENVSYRTLQGLRIQDAMARLFNSTLAQFVGFPLDLVTGNLIRSACAKALDAVTVSPQNLNGYLTPGSVNGVEVPAWDDLTVTTDGLQTWTINVNAHPVGESDYIHVVLNLSPVSINL